MLESLIITLREGIEVALVVGIVAAYLKKMGRATLNRYVYWGLALAVGASVAGAFAFQHLAVNEEVFEGGFMLAAAVFVGSMVVWMWRTAKGIKGEIERRVGAMVEDDEGRSDLRQGLAVLLFTFLMVFREGVETVIFLSAVSLATDTLLSFFGGVLGLGLSVAFGAAFVKGSVRIDLGRFFKVTGVVLMIFVVQLLVNSFHELSEGGVLPSSEREMAVIGPIVRHNLFFILAIVALPVVVLMIPGRKRAETAAEGETPADRRKRLAAARAQRRWRNLAGASAFAVMAILGLDWIYPSGSAELSPPTMVTAEDGWVRIPLAQVNDGDLHRFGYPVEGAVVRFLLIRTEGDRIGSALDACEICGNHGYYQNGRDVICKNCIAQIYIPTIGKGGGCNPIALSSRVEDGTVWIKTDDLEAAAGVFK